MRFSLVSSIRGWESTRAQEVMLALGGGVLMALVHLLLLMKTNVIALVGSKTTRWAVTFLVQRTFMLVFDFHQLKTLICNQITYSTDSSTLNTLDNCSTLDTLCMFTNISITRCKRLSRTDPVPYDTTLMSVWAHHSHVTFLKHHMVVSQAQLKHDTRTIDSVWCRDTAERWFIIR